MGLRFRKRIGRGPVHLNLSRSGASTSFTVAGVTINPTRRRVWANLPGPFYWSQTLPRRRRP